MKKTFLAGLALATTILSGNTAFAADQIRAVGSSTVFPFVTAVAEEFGKAKKFKAPVVESTGTGGGFKLFCSAGDSQPDIANASRAIKQSEKDLCAKAGVKDIVELKIGYDGIVLANSNKHKQFELSREQVFLALARQVPKAGKLVNNPYQKWSDIDSKLPAQKIEVYGPPPTSGTRDAFVELVMDASCKAYPEFAATFKDEDALKKACQQIREDGAYIEAGENDNLIVQKLSANANALGIFGYSFLEQNKSTIQGSKINGVEPTEATILGHTYPIFRPLFVYVNKAHVGKTPGLKEFLQELSAEKALGDEGYLVFKGLIPDDQADRDALRQTVEKL